MLEALLRAGREENVIPRHTQLIRFAAGGWRYVDIEIKKSGMMEHC